MTPFEWAILLGIIGSVGTSAASIGGSLWANSKNAQLNQQRWQDQVDLANSAHQREVSDLRLAGLNPILSTGTAGAAVPSQASAEISNPLEGIGNLGGTLSNMITNSATMKSQALLNTSNAELNDKRNEVMSQDIAKGEGDAAVSRITKDLSEEEDVKNALRDKLLLEGAPKNAYEAAYLSLRKGLSSVRSPNKHEGEKPPKKYDKDNTPYKPWINWGHYYPGVFGH